MTPLETGFLFQHDLYFIAPAPGDGWSTYPNEHFFIAKFNGSDPGTNGKSLRLREYEEFSTRRYTTEALDYLSRVREFHSLCRGEALVSP